MAQKPLIVANWKANKTIKEALEWLKEFCGKGEVGSGKWEKVEIVICPPFTVLEPLKLSIINYQLSIKLGAQDISPFDNGSYTGEVSARMLVGLVDYVLVGHSERRKNFGETTEVVGKKVETAQKAGMSPIICAAGFQEIPKVTNNFCLMYEPPEAISRAGVYRPDNPETAQKTLVQWKSKLGKANPRCLYGGSVNPQNVAKFLAQPDIDGVVVGHASLDPATFISLLNNVSS